MEPRWSNTEELGRPRALITGITGQDGLYLAELLLAKGYDVYGLIRGQNNPKRDLVEQTVPGRHAASPATCTDLSSLMRALRDAEPDEVYNLGAISFVAYSWENARAHQRRSPGMGVLNMLEAIRLYAGDDPATGALLPGVELGDVRQGAGGPAARDDAAVAALAVRRGQGLRPLHDDQLPRVLRHARLVAGSCSTTSRRAADRSSSPARSARRSPGSPSACRTSWRWATSTPSATGASPATTSTRCG